MRRKYYDRYSSLYETRNNGRHASRLYEDYGYMDDYVDPSELPPYDGRYGIPAEPPKKRHA